MPYRDKDKGRDYQREWTRQNAERVNARRRARYDAYKARLKHVRDRYGLTEEEYLALPDHCEICGTSSLLGVDHEHDTGQVRGTLCRNCNAGLGNFRDSPELLHLAIDYLERKGMN